MISLNNFSSQSYKNYQNIQFPFPIKFLQLGTSLLTRIKKARAFHEHLWFKKQNSWFLWLTPLMYIFDSLLLCLIDAFHVQWNNFTRKLTLQCERTITYSNLTHFQPIFHFYTPENIRNPEVSWHFQEVWKLARFIGLKRDKCARTQQ